MPHRHSAFLLLAFAAFTPAAFAQEGDDTGPGVKVDWKKGPVSAELGSDIAELEVPEGYAFANAEDTRRVLEAMGNRTDGSELGMVVPNAEDEGWFIVFEWQPIGYIKDAEKEKIDADELLESIQEATEEGNEWRKENNIPALHVTGWAEPPNYDPASHNLVWAAVARSEGSTHDSVNYNMRLLGRRGVVSATLVESADKLALSKPHAAAMVNGFKFKTGGSYSEWKAGDKVAAYGLTGLVAAGAGAAAVKLGLFGVLAKFFGKMGKAIVVAVVAGVAALGKVVKSIFGRKQGP